MTTCLLCSTTFEDGLSGDVEYQIYGSGGKLHQGPVCYGCVGSRGKIGAYMLPEVKQRRWIRAKKEWKPAKKGNGEWVVIPGRWA